VTQRLLLVGVSHPTAPIELRDRLAQAAEGLGGGALVVLGTCNRFELYAEVDDVDTAGRRLVSELARRAGVDRRELAAAVTVATDDDVVRHLCRVAAGLDSPILGEPQILGQVRRAAASAATPLLARLFACAVRAGRRTRNETGLGRRPGSLAAAAAGIAADCVGDLAGRRVLVVGAGTMGELVATSFRGLGCELVVASRTREHAAALAARVAGRAAPFDGLALELAAADIVVCCTRSPQLVVGVDEVVAARRTLLLIDLALPRDVDPAVAAVDGCRLYDLDAVFATTGAERARAGRHVDAAESIVREEAARFVAWRRSRAAAATIASLRGRAEAIRASELARMHAKLGTLDAEERRAVELVTTQILNKLLHVPTTRVKEAEGGDLMSALSRLFALEDAA
jgi:glutamyl-tRNA reductase